MLQFKNKHAYFNILKNNTILTTQVKSKVKVPLNGVGHFLSRVVIPVSFSATLSEAVLSQSAMVSLLHCNLDRT